MAKRHTSLLARSMAKAIRPRIFCFNAKRVSCNSAISLMITTHPAFLKVQEFIRNEHLLDSIEHIEVALSGGADSVCLLAILSSMPHTYTLRAHHIRHGLRPDDVNDARIARNVANRFSVEFIQTDLTWPDGIPASNVEETARNSRYHALTNALTDIPHAAIALAHHGDENLETALWRIGRGCGIEGLTLSIRRELNDIQVIRPLLMLSKAEIYQFLRDEAIEWAEDPTNQSSHYRRNRIRHEILPKIKSEATNDSTLYRTLITLRHDANTVSSLANAFVRRYPVTTGGWFCPWHDWEMLNPEAASQVLRHAVRAVIPNHCPTEKFIRNALDCLHNRLQTRRQIENGTIHIGWAHGGVMIWSNADDIQLPDITFEIPCTDLKIWKFCSLTSWFSVPDTTLKNTTSMLHIDAGQLDGSMVIRPASRFSELRTSTGNLTKVREALRSQGIPDNLRPHWPVLCCGNKPLWILGGMRTFDAHPAVSGQKAASFILAWQ